MEVGKHITKITENECIFLSFLSFPLISNCYLFPNKISQIYSYKLMPKSLWVWDFVPVILLTTLHITDWRHTHTHTHTHTRQERERERERERRITMTHSRKKPTERNSCYLYWNSPICTDTHREIWKTKTTSNC